MELHKEEQKKRKMAPNLAPMTHHSVIRRGHSRRNIGTTLNQFMVSLFLEIIPRLMIEKKTTLLSLSSDMKKN